MSKGIEGEEGTCHPISTLQIIRSPGIQVGKAIKLTWFKDNDLE